MVCFIISEGNWLSLIFLQPSPFPVSTPRNGDVRNYAALTAFLFANWETDQWGHRDHKSKRVGGVGLLRYGSTLTWHVPNKCQRGYWDGVALQWINLGSAWILQSEMDVRGRGTRWWSEKSICLDEMRKDFFYSLYFALTCNTQTQMNKHLHAQTQSTAGK